MTHKPCYLDPKTYPNIMKIRKMGLNIWLKEQSERRTVLKEISNRYDEGKSMTLYCTAAALMPINHLREAIIKTEKIVAEREVEDSDLKTKAKIFKSIIQDLSLKDKVDLKLRKKPKNK